jgi:hypothetical protein
MTAELGCEQVRELAPELALSIAEGEERDAALRDLSGCRGAAAGLRALLGRGRASAAGAGPRPTSRVRVPRPGRPHRAAMASEHPAARPPLAMAVLGHGRRSSARRQLPGGSEPGTRLTFWRPRSKEPGAGCLAEPRETWRGQLPVDLSAVHHLRFVGSDGRTAFAATFATANPRD